MQALARRRPGATCGAGSMRGWGFDSADDIDPFDELDADLNPGWFAPMPGMREDMIVCGNAEPPLVCEAQARTRPTREPTLTRMLVPGMIGSRGPVGN